MIKRTLNTILLFLASTLIPITSFILPVYRIRTMPLLPFKDRFLSTLISASIIFFIDSKLFLIFIGVFLVIEGSYNFFEKTDIKIFDRIFISTTISSIIVYVMIGTFVGTPTELADMMKKIYTEYISVDPVVLKITLNYVRDQLPVIVFSYLLVINYLTYLLLKGVTYRKWTISYLWILVFIISFFINNILKIDNYYTKNLYFISIFIYILYGIRVLYSIFRYRISWKIYAKLLTIATAYFFPVVVFIIGAINSFGLVKIKIRRE